MADRILQVNELIRKELGNLIAREVEFTSGTLVTITDVAVSKDLRHASVYISVLPSQYSDEALALLKKSKQLTGQLHRKLHLKPLPRLHFFPDHTEENAKSIENLLDQLRENG